MKCAERTIQSYHFPLYLYSDDNSLTQERTPNLDQTIVNQIAEGLHLTFTSEKSDEPDTFAPIDLLDYIYAVLHSPSYREKYKEFLKIDFPRVPYPDDTDTFWKLVALGGRLRTIHLMESQELSPLITQYPVSGDNIITRKIVKKDFEIVDEEKGLGRVWINDEQYFDNIPVKAWEFYIGGYQPAQKWLKDRKERTLSYDDILHYQKIVKALVLTDEIMQEIDAVIGEML
jgi:predicted helicase